MFVSALARNLMGKVLKRVQKEQHGGRFRGRRLDKVAGKFLDGILVTLRDVPTCRWPKQMCQSALDGL